MTQTIRHKKTGIVRDSLGRFVKGEIANPKGMPPMTPERKMVRKILKKTAVKAVESILERYQKELSAIQDAMELKDKNSEAYKVLVEAADKVQKQIQLLSGGRTGNEAIVIPITNVFRYNSNAKDSQTPEED